MKIHHATAAKASTHAINMDVIEADDREYARATLATGTEVIGVHGGQTLDAALVQKAFEVDYPAMNIYWDKGEGHYAATCLNAEQEPVTVWTGKIAPAIQDLLDAVDEYNEANETELDPEQGFVEQKAAVVVPSKYKEIYREQGNPNNCGDEVAEFLDGKFIGVDAKFDICAFIDFCSLNGVEPTTKLNAMMEQGNRGWTGRMRMNLGQMLRRKIAETGEVVYNTVEGQKVKRFSVAYLEQLAAKFPKVEPKWKDA